MKIALTIIGVFIVIVMSIAGWIMSAKFTAERHEQGITYSVKNMQNVHSSVGKIISTSGLTVKNFSKTKIDAINAKIKQYADKPKMMMMWVKENPQQIDSKVWEKFQDQMEKQYLRFDNEQKMKISRSQAYNTYLKSTYKGMISEVVWSYPTEKVKKLMDDVIQTAETKATFETGIDKAVETF